MNDRAETLAVLSQAAPLPESASGPPEWITIFPSLGDVKTRDGRSYRVDGAEIIRAFEASRLDIPIDVNHSTDTAAPRGERSDAVGWISRLRVEAGALQGKVEWSDEGRALLARRAYRYVSPSFMHKQDGRATWIKAVSLVNVPALAHQPALAAAGYWPKDRVIYNVVSTPLPLASATPDWVVVFPALGFVETAGGLIFYIDAKAILEDFNTAAKARDDDFRQFPVNVDHRPDTAVDAGQDIASPPIGEIRELRIKAGRLEARVEWTADGKTLLNAGSYAATSPAFFDEASGKVERLKSISLVRRVTHFAKARATGNDVTREEADSFSTRPESVAENAASSFAATVPPSAGAGSSSHSAPGSRARPDAPASEALATGKKIADLANALVAQAKRGGATLSFLDAVSQATARLGVCDDAEDKEDASSASAGGGDAAALSIRDVNERILAANALIADYAAAGQSLTFVQAFERLGAEAAGAAGEARAQGRRSGDPSALDAHGVIARANRLVAEHRAAGLSLSFVDAVERTVNS